MEFYLRRHFYLQDLAGGNQHLIKFLVAGDFSYIPIDSLLTREDYKVKKIIFRLLLRPQ
jgi:hypothetical protein